MFYRELLGMGAKNLVTFFYCLSMLENLYATRPNIFGIKLHQERWKNNMPIVFNFRQFAWRNENELTTVVVCFGPTSILNLEYGSTCYGRKASWYNNCLLEAAFKCTEKTKNGT